MSPSLYDILLHIGGIALSTLLIKKDGSIANKIIGYIFLATFAYFLGSDFGLIVRRGYDMITMIIALMVFLPMLFKQKISLSSKLFMSLVPAITAIATVFRVLHINGIDQIRLLCALTVVLVLAYILVTYLRKKSLGNLSKLIEINGLFVLSFVVTVI